MLAFLSRLYGVLLLVVLSQVSFAVDVYPTETVLMSAAPGGGAGNHTSDSPSFSTDGRYLVFASRASDLVAGDTNSYSDIFVKNMATGEIRLVSTNTSGVVGNQDCGSPSISRNGRYVAFASGASNLVPDDTNSSWDVFVKDMVTGTLSLVSRSASGVQGNYSSSRPDINDDATFVAFETSASNLIAGINTNSQIVVKNLVSGEVKVASSSSAGVLGTAGTPEAPSISADGRFVGFHSSSSNLVAGDTNGSYDAFVKDMQIGSIAIASRSQSGVLGNGDSGVPTLSATGRYVFYVSWADNLVPGDTNGKTDCFVTDMETGQVKLVSTAADGTQGNGESGPAGAGVWWNQSISPNGRFVTYASFSSNLVAGTSTFELRVYVKDLQNGKVVLVSAAAGRTQPFGGDMPAISADGRYVAFTSRHAFDPYDANTYGDVYVHGTGFSTKRKTALALGSSVAYVGKYVVLTAFLKDGPTRAPIADANVKFWMDGQAISEPMLTDEFGKVGMVYALGENEPLGSRTFSVGFAGDTAYAPSYNTRSFTVEPGPVRITVRGASGTPGTTVVLSATITNASLLPLGGRSLVFKVNGTSVGSATSNYLGVASKSYTIPTGMAADNYPITVTFASDEKHKAGSGSGTLTVK